MVKVWDACTGLDLLTLKGHTHAYSASFSSDGFRIVSGGDNMIKVWDARPLNHSSPRIVRWPSTEAKFP